MRRTFEVARDAGRTKVAWFGWVGEQTSGFAKALGFEPKSVAVNRRQHLRELEPGLAERLYAEAEPHAHDYELLRIVAPTPEDLLPALAEATEAINDAPLDDIEMEDEVFSAGAGPRLRARPARQRLPRSTGSSPGTASRASWRACRSSPSTARTRASATSTTPRSSAATVGTGSGSCSRPT